MNVATYPLRTSERWAFSRDRIEVPVNRPVTFRRRARARTTGSTSRAVGTIDATVPLRIIARSFRLGQN